MAKKQINNIHKPTSAQKVILTTCGTIIAAFILLILFTASGLIFVTVPYILILLAIWNSIRQPEIEDSTASRLTLVFAIFGVMSAVFLFYFYAPFLYGISWR
jgi:uncharacterized BrkB/YihY/UPF0761 family membrane protein